MARPDGDSDALNVLLDMSASTSDASNFSEIAAVLSRTAAPLVGAANAAVAVIAQRESALRIFQGPSATTGSASIRLVDLAEQSPLTDAVRTGEPVLVRSSEEFGRLYPRIAERTSPGEVTAMATYPLVLDGQVLAACFFRFAGDIELNENRLRLMEQMLPFLVRGIARIQDRTELLAHAQRLEQSNRDLDNFAAIVAHDLSAPVRRIGSFLQLLEREIGPLTSTAQRYADTVAMQVRHLDALLRDTLAYAQVVAPTDSRQATSLTEVLLEVMEPLQPEFDRLGVTTSLGELPVLDIEVTLVQQVFADLFDNALKYRHVERRPSIEITAEALPHEPEDNHGWWTISFTDNGIGIDPARHDEVFAMFARLEVSSDRPGTGVGLAFVKRVVERHGGNIGIAPGVDGGTTFWFTLPGPAEVDVL